MGLAADLDIHPVSQAPIARAVRWFSGIGPGAWLLSRTLRYLDRAVLRISRGRTTVSDGLGGVPTIFLTTTGARTGKPRTAQLIAVPVGEDLAVIGSNFGRPEQPGWVANLAADPRARAARQNRSVAVRARELTGPEADLVWVVARPLYRGFSTFPGMVAGRTIRVFTLTRA